MSERLYSEFIMYQTEDGLTKIQVRLTDQTVWLTQTSMVELFQSSKANISEHIKHIFEEGELNEKSVVRKFRTTAADGKRYDTNLTRCAFSKKAKRISSIKVLLYIFARRKQISFDKEDLYSVKPFAGLLFRHIAERG